MGYTNDLLTGLAQHLTTLDLGLTYNPDSVYTAAQTGIVIGPMPPSPEKVVALQPYTVRSGARSDVTQGVQIRIRGATRTPINAVNDLADDIYDALHGATDVDLGPIRVSLIIRASHALMGPDANARQETSSNYYLETAHPSAHVTD